MADVMPERIIQGKDKGHFNFNIHEIEIEDPDGTTRTAYEYEYVEIGNPITKAKIIKALEDVKLDVQEEIDPVVIEANYNKSKEAIKLSGFADFTYSRLDTYITNHVTDLSSAKKYLKRLSKLVLAILKHRDIK